MEKRNPNTQMNLCLIKEIWQAYLHVSGMAPIQILVVTNKEVRKCHY